VNYTRFPKEDYLQDWARRDNQVKTGERVNYLPQGLKKSGYYYVPPVLILKLYNYPTERICGFIRLSELTPIISLNNINLYRTKVTFAVTQVKV
jgi:hypothetical protein